MPNYNTVQLQIIRIPGDGSCLFRAVVHSSCIIRGKPPPSETLQKKLADELRDKVVEELIKRRKDAEWYLEDEFDRYISRMRQYHVWGGEAELLMASHVLQMPITVYMNDKKSCNFILIAEYGQDYGWQNPVRILYHGYGHYDALKVAPLLNGAVHFVIPSKKFETPSYMQAAQFLNYAAGCI